jgi:hypothetical protein
MIAALPAFTTPAWLAEIAADPERSRTAPLPLERILTDSLYYPACGLNGTPVKFLGGNVHAFVYADYLMTKERFLANLLGSDRDAGFRGYRPILLREVFAEEVVPTGWRPPVEPTRGIEWLIRRQREARPFGHWSVWQRQDAVSASTGPELFSFFYLAGEMSAVYQGLYYRLGLVPKILAIIQPGAMGGEWENVAHDSSFFREVVQKHPGGMPPYLLNGGTGGGYEKPCWSDYGGDCLALLPERSARLWRRAVP